MSAWAVLGVVFGLSVIYGVVRLQRKVSHCPDCGKKLGPIKKNQNGWEYRECGNKDCSTVAIGLDKLLDCRRA